MLHFVGFWFPTMGICVALAFTIISPADGIQVGDWKAIVFLISLVWAASRFKTRMDAVEVKVDALVENQLTEEQLKNHLSDFRDKCDERYERKHSRGINAGNRN